MQSLGGPRLLLNCCTCEELRQDIWYVLSSVPQEVFVAGVVPDVVEDIVDKIQDV
jgi:hypothetical protein